MIETVEGIVINEKSYRETSKILNVLTKEYGMIGMIAKGAKQIKSPLRSTTGRMIYGKFHIIYKKDKLSTLTGVDVINYFKQIQTDIDKISYASFLLELTEQVVKNHYYTSIYELLISALCKIEEGFDELVITNIVELKYLDYLGVKPNLDNCSNCGSQTGIVTLSSSAGGYLCKNCITKLEHNVDPKVLKLIRMYYYVDINKIEKLEIKEHLKWQINTFLDEYYDRYTGLYLKSKTFLKSLHNIIK